MVPRHRAHYRSTRLLRRPCPRQTGKTTAMLALAQELTASDRYTAIMVSTEVGQPFSHDPDKAATTS
ncbi:hypothetical protein U2F10_05035 [Leptothoe sp. EHU-05/26/07-4]